MVYNIKNTICRGTERQHVANDYAKRLHIGSTQCQGLIHDVLGSLIGSKSAEYLPPLMVFCEYLNASICPEVEKEHSVRGGEGGGGEGEREGEGEGGREISEGMGNIGRGNSVKLRPMITRLTIR
jgi:hypothetical protein